MNNKEMMLWQILDIVVGCCATAIDEKGTMSVTKEQVLGRDKGANVVMTRCILSRMILFEGYTVETVALLLKRTPRAVRNMRDQGANLYETSRAYRLAEVEATIKCKELFKNI